MLFLSSMAEHQRAGETWEYSTKRANEGCCETLSISAVLATFLVHPHNRVQAADCRRLLNGREPAKVSEI
jgi:hypothetical protein